MNIFVILVVLVRLAIAVALLRAGRRHGQGALLWLGLFFAGNGIANIFLPSGLLPNPIIFTAINLITGPALVLFTQRTFYQNRPSPWRIVLPIRLAGSAATIALLWSAAGFQLRQPAGYAHLLLPEVIAGSISWAWHTWAAWRGWRALRSDPQVEPWVKARYCMIIAYGSMMIVALLPMPAQEWMLRNPVLSVIQGLAGFGSLFLQYLAWCMPEWLRRSLNRGYQAPLDDSTLPMTEEELQRLLRSS